MTTLLYTHPDCAEHLVPPGHPERPQRLQAISDALGAARFKPLWREDAPLGALDRVLLAHPEPHVERLRQLVPASGFAQIDADTLVSPKSWEAALRGVGAATGAVDRVVGNKAANAFCAVRPPGHHAESVRAMGFCLFNSAAIAALHACDRHGLERVAVVDFDVHHGNGTQEIFWERPHLFYGSTHQMPLYPGTGAAGETGGGNIFNAPLAPGSGGAAFREAMAAIILPALESFTPELIVVSAGFDAHARDPLANLNLVEDDFAWATRKLLDVAEKHAGGRLVSTLEGGYDLDALGASAAAHVAALMEAGS